MMQLVRCTAIAFLILLSGCAVKGIPKYNQESTVLIIPKSAHNKSSEQWVRRYELELSSGGQTYDLWIDNGDSGYQIFDELPSGHYVIESIKWKIATGWRAKRSMDEGLKVEIPFELKPGAVTIAPIVLDYEQTDSGSSIMSSYGYFFTEDQQYSDIKADLEKLKEGRIWLENSSFPMSETIRNSI